MRNIRLSFCVSLLAGFLALAGGPRVAAATPAAADTVSGRVVDAGGQGVAGATVLFPDLHRSATTDSAGRFYLVNVPAGRYTAVVRRVGYAPLVKDVDLTPSAPLTLAIESTAFELDAVTVTATRSAIAPLASPLPTASLNQDQLRKNQNISLAHALADLAGVRAVTTGGEIGKPMIRGLTGSRVLVMADGNRVEDYSWSDEDGPSLDARMAQRVEVIRGPASVLYGSDALGGVVNVVPGDLPDANGGPGFVRGGYELYGATNNNELGSALRFEGASGNLGWRLFGVGRFSEALHTPTGELENTGFFAVNGEGAVGLRGARGNGTLRVSHYGGEFKLLEANGPPPGTVEGQEEGPVRKLDDERVQFGGNYLVGALRLEAKGQFQRHSLIEVSDDANPSGTGPGQEVPAFDLLLNTTSLDLMAHHAAGNVLRGTVGISGLYQTNATRGPIPLVPGASINSGAVFAFEEARFNKWSLLAGGRVESRHLSADANSGLNLTAQSRDYTPVSGDVGLVFRPVESLALAANVGRAWRSPTLFELFTNGPHLGEARYEVGDAALVPETGTDIDMSVRWQGGPLHAEVSGFRNAVGNFIYITPTNNFLPAPNGDTLRVYNYLQADARLWGGEASAEVEVAAPLTLRGRFDYVRGVNDATNEWLPLMPPPRGAVGADLHGSTSWADRVQFGGEVELYGTQTRLNPLDVTPDAFTNSYALLNLTAGIERLWLGHPMRLDVQVYNALNTSYKSFLSRYKEFALNPGRNIVVRLSTAP